LAISLVEYWVKGRRFGKQKGLKFIKRGKKFGTRGGLIREI